MQSLLWMKWPQIQVLQNNIQTNPFPWSINILDSNDRIFQKISPSSPGLLKLYSF